MSVETALLLGGSCIALLGLTVYTFLTWNFKYWQKLGIRGPKPQALGGTYPNLFTQRKHFADDLRDIYFQYRSRESYVGCFLLRTPQLLVLEPKLIREILVSAFKHFEDNDVAQMVDTRKDALVACNPFVLAGAEWREQRALFTPLLTSVRIRTAYSIMQRVCQDLGDYIAKQCVRTEPINGKDLALRFTADNLLDCVLGIRAHSFSEQPLPVAHHIQQLSEENISFLLAGALAGLYPRMFKHFRFKIFPRSCDRFFSRLTTDAFQLRRRQHQERNDFINQLLEMQRQHGLSDRELSSHAMTFLIDGLDTTAATISHCLLLLARYPTCQQRLLAELSAACADGLPSYDQLNELPYLDACFNESLRIYPPGLWAAKTCTEAYTLLGTRQSTPITLQPGDTVMIPIYGLHHDPMYYAEPAEFRPERFLPENGGVKKYRNMGVFLGFGDGPRHCVGVRLALAQSKAAIAAIVSRFQVKENARTAPGQALDPNIFVTLHKGGVWLDFEPRSA